MAYAMLGTASIVKKNKTPKTSNNIDTRKEMSEIVERKGGNGDRKSEGK